MEAIEERPQTQSTQQVPCFQQAQVTLPRVGGSMSRDPARTRAVPCLVLVGAEQTSTVGSSVWISAADATDYTRAHRGVLGVITNHGESLRPASDGITLKPRGVRLVDPWVTTRRRDEARS